MGGYRVYGATGDKGECITTTSTFDLALFAFACHRDQWNSMKIEAPNGVVLLRYDSEGRL